MPRFVILHHTFSPGHALAAHFDVMFECGPALRTWAVAEAIDSGNRQPARQLADHRPFYLDYEGPVSNDRGQVTRVDAGQYALLADTPDCWTALLSGSGLQGTIRIDRDNAADQRWTLAFSPG